MRRNARHQGHGRDKTHGIRDMDVAHSISKERRQALARQRRFVLYIVASCAASATASRPTEVEVSEAHTGKHT
jgi:O-phosphoseryl-tRNA(Cys) synthetase